MKSELQAEIDSTLARWRAQVAEQQDKVMTGEQGGMVGFGGGYLSALGLCVAQIEQLVGSSAKSIVERA